MNFTTVGLQRTGTNYVRGLLREYPLTHLSQSPGNFHHYDFFAWKHWASPQRFSKDVSKDHIVIVVAKHPVKWLESILRNPVDICYTYPYLQYGSHRVHIPHRWRLNQFEYISVEKLLQHYQVFYTNWLNTKRFHNYFVVNYENMLDNDAINVWVKQFTDKLNLKFKPVVPLSYVPMSGERDQQYLESYKKGQYNLPGEYIELAEKMISAELMERLTYQF